MRGGCNSERREGVNSEGGKNERKEHEREVGSTEGMSDRYERERREGKGRGRWKKIE